MAREAPGCALWFPTILALLISPRRREEIASAGEVFSSLPVPLPTPRPQLRAICSLDNCTHSARLFKARILTVHGSASLGKSPPHGLPRPFWFPWSPPPPGTSATCWRDPLSGADVWGRAPFYSPSQPCPMHTYKVQGTFQKSVSFLLRALPQPALLVSRKLEIQSVSMVMAASGYAEK